MQENPSWRQRPRSRPAGRLGAPRPRLPVLACTASGASSVSAPPRPHCPMSLCTGGAHALVSSIKETPMELAGPSLERQPVTPCSEQHRRLGSLEMCGHLCRFQRCREGEHSGGQGQGTTCLPSEAAAPGNASRAPNEEQAGCVEGANTDWVSGGFEGPVGRVTRFRVASKYKVAVILHQLQVPRCWAPACIST